MWHGKVNSAKLWQQIHRKKASRLCGQGAKAFWSNTRQAGSSYWAISTDAWKRKKPHCFNFDFRCETFPGRLLPAPANAAPYKPCAAEPPSRVAPQCLRSTWSRQMPSPVGCRVCVCVYVKSRPVFPPPQP